MGVSKSVAFSSTFAGSDELLEVAPVIWREVSTRLSDTAYQADKVALRGRREGRIRVSFGPTSRHEQAAASHSHSQSDKNWLFWLLFMRGRFLLLLNVLLNFVPPNPHVYMASKAAQPPSCLPIFLVSLAHDASPRNLRIFF